ncbi:MAG: hypothetical protein HY084_11090 [Gemmatimonadetes bacterium]|nr:hypothetical protein [Gemmatimonadota bacterium]
MRKFLAIAAMSLVMAGTAAAQGGGGGMGGMQMDPAQMQQRTFDRLFKDITVTDAVKTKAMDIIKKHQGEMAAIDPQAADRRDQMMHHRTAMHTELKGLLTSDADKATFDKNAAAPMGRRGGGPPR